MNFVPRPSLSQCYFRARGWIRGARKCKIARGARAPSAKPSEERRAGGGRDGSVSSLVAVVARNSAAFSRN